MKSKTVAHCRVGKHVLVLLSEVSDVDMKQG